MSFTSTLILCLCAFLVDARIENDACTGFPEGGFCRGSFERFYFDPSQGTCLSFVYGGCGGNNNNYGTFEECINSCGNKQSANDILPSLVEKKVALEEKEEVAVKTHEPEECFLPQVTGNCFGYFPRYYYNHESNTCQKFIYGGCRGNGNNFLDLDSCESRCKRSANEEDNERPKLSEDALDALLPTCFQKFGKNGGANGIRCMAYIPRWSFDQQSKECKEYIYGGCGGNRNSFVSKEECQKTCLA